MVCCTLVNLEASETYFKPLNKSLHQWVTEGLPPIQYTSGDQIQENSLGVGSK